jgi:hypothetical protein
LGSAKLTYDCKSDFSTQLAFVHCGEAAFTATCKAEGLVGIVSLSYSTANIDKECQVQCPAGVTTFQLKGTLIFVNKEQLSNINTIISTNHEKAFEGIDFNFLTSFFLVIGE